MPHTLLRKNFLGFLSYSLGKYYQVSQWNALLPACMALFQGPNTKLLMYDTPQWARHLIFQALLASYMKKDVAKKAEKNT